MSEPDTQQEQISIGEKARQTVADIVDGNGMKGTDVRIDEIEETIYVVPGTLEIKLEVDRHDHVVPGPRPDVDADPAESESDLEQKIGHETDKILTDPQEDHALLEKIADEDGYGWGLNHVRLKIPELDRGYYITKQCLPCKGSGRTPCTGCQGSGRTGCTKCSGQGTMKCTFCKKTGFIENPTTNEKQPCHHCQGRGLTGCTACQGQRTMPCGKCGGSAQENCGPCGASGHVSQVAALTFEAVTEFSLPEENIPDDVLEAIRTIGIKEIATQKHAKIVRLKKEEAQQELGYHEEPKDGKQRVHFRAHLPFARATLSLDTKKVPILIVGFRATILKTGRFLDALLKPGIKQLKQAAEGVGNTKYLIKKACKYRALKTAIVNISGHSEGKVAKALLKKYPLGLSKKYAKNITHYSDLALRQVTRKSRYIGLGVGLALSTAVSYGYFFHGLRAQVLSMIPDPQLYVGADLGLTALCLGIGVYSIKIMARKALMSVLPKKGKSSLPSAGTAGYYAVFGIPLIVLAAAYLAPEQPEWLVMVLNR